MQTRKLHCDGQMHEEQGGACGIDHIFKEPCGLDVVSFHGYELSLDRHAGVLMDANKSWVLHGRPLIMRKNEEHGRLIYSKKGPP